MPTLKRASPWLSRLPWHPCPPPLSPSPLPSLLPSLLLARQPCHRLHRLATLTLLVACHPHCRHSPCRRHRPCCCSPCTLVLLIACHPHCRHSRCRRHRPHCCSPRTLVSVAIALATVASTIIIARHPCCRRNRPLCCLCLHLPATLVSVMPPRVGEGRIIPTSELLLTFV